MLTVQLPTEYFERCLGMHKKYSSCLWADQNTTLDEAEEAMLGVIFQLHPALLHIHSSTQTYFRHNSQTCCTRIVMH